jgi:hypothetical protein
MLAIEPELPHGPPASRALPAPDQRPRDHNGRHRRRDTCNDRNEYGTEHDITDLESYEADGLMDKSPALRIDPGHASWIESGPAFAP